MLEKKNHADKEKMAQKLAQPLIKIINTHQSSTYCARVDAGDDIHTLAQVVSLVHEKCPGTILLLCSCGASSVVAVVAWPLHKEGDVGQWIDLSCATLSYAHKEDIDLQSPCIHATRIEFAPNSEQFPEKAADQLVGNANAQLKKWKLLDDGDDDEREYTFDDIQ